jgi:hypothetical protein
MKLNREERTHQKTLEGMGPRRRLRGHQRRRLAPTQAGRLGLEANCLPLRMTQFNQPLSRILTLVLSRFVRELRFILPEYITKPRPPEESIIIRSRQN